MNNNYKNIFKNSIISKKIIKILHNISKKKIKIMEVCGTHTVSIFKSGIRSILPKSIELCSGPGCPVCVTDQMEIDSFIELAKQKDVIITTFGDLIKVPGTNSSLQKERSKGANIRIVYSTFDALNIAKENINKKVIFLGIGFETTAPTIAAAVITAKKLNINNFYIASAHKLVVPVLETITKNKKINIDGFILPGHVSTIIGVKAYTNFWNKNKIPCVIAGFETLDLLRAIFRLVLQIEYNKPRLENIYERVVPFEPNLKAIKLLKEVFKITNSTWRGIGKINNSGLKLNNKFKNFDAFNFFDIKKKNYYKTKGCNCGEILMGIKTPLECNLYKKKCTPINPIGPCMVSTEGTCSTYYKYNDDTLNLL